MEAATTIDILLAKLRIRLLSGGMSKAEADARMPVVNDRGNIYIEIPRSGMHQWADIKFESRNNDEFDIDQIFKLIQRQHKKEIREQGMIDACHFVRGTEPDRPYMVDVVADAFLKSQGLDWQWFGDALDRVVLRMFDKTILNLDRSVGRGFQSWMVGGKVHPFERIYAQSTATRVWEFEKFNSPVQLVLQRNGLGLLMDFKVGQGSWEASGNPCLSLKQKFPESIYSGAKGRELSEIVGHPAFMVPGLIVNSMRWVGNRTIIQVKNVKLNVKNERINGPAKSAIAA